jgi:hypothetical protein
MLMTRLNHPLTLTTALVLLSVPAPASDPVGIYALVDRVVVEPDVDDAQRIQVWGTFALALSVKRENGREVVDMNAYQPAQRGYLYYSMNATNPRATRAEWADLQAVAGKGEIVGFGSRFENVGRVRRAGETPSDPDVFPLGFGMVRGVRSTSGRVEQDLRACGARSAECRSTR